MTAACQQEPLGIASRPEGEREFPFSPDEYRYLAQIVYQRSGIVLGDHKINMVYSRLVRRLRALKLNTFAEYCELLGGPEGDQELGSMINAITTNLTKFYRENHHFEHLRDVVIPEIERTGRRRLRIWSAGCSSGEEPYSIAITTAMAIPAIAQWDARILATDLDTKMVATGQAGVYSSEAVEELSKQVQSNYFARVAGGKDGGRQVVDSIRRLITFKHLNLLGNWPMKGPFDAIFCRNVMIYFDGPTKTELVRRYAGMLKPEGWLYIGHSESLLDSQSNFKLSGRTIYRKLRS